MMAITMINIFHKIFLPDTKLAKTGRQHEVLRLISSVDVASVSHQSFVKINGGVVRCFSVSNNGGIIYATRTYEPSLPEKHQIKYSLIYTTNVPKRVLYATNSDVDKFAKHTYIKMYKMWEKSRFESIRIRKIWKQNKQHVK